MGAELWKSDGTADGTVLVQDINALPLTAFRFPPHHFTNVAGTLYFAAEDGERGYELWKSDGTADGTVLVQDIQPGNSRSSSTPDQFYLLNGVIFFTADDGEQGRELWRTDGTADGTVLVQDIRTDRHAYP